MDAINEGRCVDEISRKVKVRTTKHNPMQIPTREGLILEDICFDANPEKWYKIGFNDLWKVKVETQEINILKAPCYLATKFEAFNSRGKDYRTSHDMEDIIYILDNRLAIVKEIEETEESIKSFLINQLNIIIEKRMLEEVLMAHIHPLMIDERKPIVLEKISQIIRQ